MAPIYWFGGKGNNKKFILDLLAEIKSEIFVDAFGGAGNILLHRYPSPVEVYNDLNGWLVNLFRVIQDPELCNQLEYKVQFTLYSRNEFARAVRYMAENNPPESPCVLAAWCMFVAYNQGFGGKANSVTNWGKSRLSEREMCSLTSKWLNKQSHFSFWHNRIMRCLIDNRPALDVCKNFDGPQTLIYLDPPYPLDTRKGGKGYTHEMTNEQHQELAYWCANAQSKIAISSYSHPIYEALGWRKETKDTFTMFGNYLKSANSRANNPDLYKRTECVYLNWNSQLKLF